MSIIQRNGWGNYYNNARIPLSRIISLFRIGTSVTVTDLYRISIIDRLIWHQSSSNSYLWEMNRLNLPRQSIVTCWLPWGLDHSWTMSTVKRWKHEKEVAMLIISIFEPHVLISARCAMMRYCLSWRFKNISRLGVGFDRILSTPLVHN
jgi:hypothetical protein